MIFHQYFNYSKLCALEIVDDNEFLSSVQDFPRMLLSETNLKFSDGERCQNILISTTNPLETFSNVEDFIQKQSEIRYHHRRYFIIHPDINELLDISKSLNNCEELNKLKFVWDVLIMTCDTIKEAFRFYTYVIKENSTINWLHLDDWFWRNQSFLFDRNLYPDRLHDVENLFGSEFRHLSAGATDYLPYSFIG